MSFDAFVTKAVAKELNETLINGKVAKIYQPFESDLLLIIRANRTNYHLCISSSANYARIHLTSRRYPNPAQPPTFCMVLRKHINGYSIKNIKQINLDRIIHIEFAGRNELGDHITKTLVVEIMGRHSNIILLDTARNIIIDSIKHLPPSINSYRTVLPGKEYVPPPSQNKANPLQADRDLILRKIDFNQGKMENQLVAQFAGLSPLISKEIIHRAGLATKDSLSKTFLHVMGLLKNHAYTPEIVHAQREAFSVISLTHLKGERTKFHSVNDMLDHFYHEKAERDQMKQQAHDLEKRLSNELKKNKRKLKKLEKTLNESRKAKQYQLYGELLTAHMHELKRGQTQAELANYYSPGEKVAISLDPAKTPAENAQAYFKKYAKAKNSAAKVKKQIEKTKENIAYFELLLTQMENASLKDIAEIREELEEEGVMKRKRKKDAKKPDKPTPESYKSSEGISILVGKNNKQNEYLTMKLARKDDTWLHAKDIPGSHVVIRGDQFSEKTLHEAAMLAAYFSKAKQSSNVPIDYTKVRHVKKPSGAKPGFVIYTNQKTLYVTPNEESVRQLRTTSD